jgi:protein-tyrosine-phosphatase/DNA-binding transcriptional ArsR family regulator
MNTERTGDLERRARLHAALSDPARLRIVDTLRLGDASPTEVQRMLAMSSNLLAHHLKVLEREGLLVRSRSEADRRRAYLHLVPDALADLLPAPAQPASRLVFVCTANSARSQIAATLWRRSSTVPAASAGTHPAAHVDSGAVEVAARHLTPLQEEQPRSIDDVLQADDLLITVCDNAHEELAQRGGVTALHWSVPDPVRVGTATAYDKAYDELTRRVTDLAPRLRAS